MFASGEDARRFLLAGNARLTLVSEKTGTRFTFRVRVKEDEGRDPVHFVAVLTGSNNDEDYAFIGTIFGGRSYRASAKAKVAADAPSAKAWAWAAPFLLGGRLPPRCEVHHEGACGKCGRALTVPESIASGLGPTCAQRE